MMGEGSGPGAGRRLAAAVLLLGSFLGGGCRGGEDPGRIYARALEALTAEDLMGRQLAVSSRMLEPSFPRLSPEILESLRDQGIRVAEGDTSEDTSLATVFLTALDTLPERRFQLLLFVAMGGGFGEMGRRDGWWRIQVDCRKECQVEEKSPAPPQEWFRVMGR